MTKDEFENLKKEYEEFTDEHHYMVHYFDATFYIHSALLLAVFILPEKIVSIFPPLRHFIDFMSGFFPNIQIYASANKMPELCAFYFSYAWAVCACVLIWYIYRLPSIGKNARKYFGVGEFRGKGILKEKFIPVVNGGIKGFMLWVFGILFLVLECI